MENHLMRVTTMSKIAIVIGRGVEGCGVTKYCVELEDWLIKNSHDTTVYASKDKKWSRNDSHTFHNLVHVHFGRDDFDEVYEGCKESDIIIFNSLPSVSHSKECIENFSKLFDLKTKKVSIQHDHNISSLRRNVLLQESYEKVDYIFAHSQTGDFAEMVNTPSLFDLDADRTIHLMQPAILFSNYKKYWKGIEEQDAHHHKWIGRTSRWKGYDLMIRFHDEYLKGAGHLTTLEGIERSPVFIEFKNQYDFYNEINSDVDEVDLLERYGDKVTVFGQYVNDELLERLSLSSYGYQLSLLGEKYMAKSLEFTHLESVAVGTVPVFRKEYGDLCIHRYYDKPLTDIDNSGTIWLSENNMEECKNLIVELTNDNDMRNEYRKNALDFYSYYDSDFVFKDMMDIVL